MTHESESDERPEHGVIDGQDGQSLCAASADPDQPTAESRRKILDTDQASSDSDQTLADSDQTSADRDQAAADRDQDASDEDLAAGGDPARHAISRDVRRQTTRERQEAAAERMRTANARDYLAHGRDLAGRARDLAAEGRDRAMTALENSIAQEDTARAVTGAEIVIRAGALRQRAARYREKAAEYRVQAAADREAAAQDRELAARDRQAASADRELLLRQVAAAETDALTGARTRNAGHEELQREIDRCHRTSIPLTVVYVDVVGLKARNDSRGHAAGDQLLIDVVACIRAHLRTYDHITRVGGDEFVCAMPNMTLAAATTRFSLIASALAAAPDPSAIRAGFAELAPSDTVATLIARADCDLTAARHS
jgi:diguanylate cyclase (GGDEF)-like protein